MIWDYKGEEVYMAMPGYVERTLKEFFHELPRKQQDLSYICTAKEHGTEAHIVEVPE